MCQTTAVAAVRPGRAGWDGQVYGREDRQVPGREKTPHIRTHCLPAAGDAGRQSRIGRIRRQGSREPYVDDRRGRDLLRTAPRPGRDHPQGRHPARARRARRRGVRGRGASRSAMAERHVAGGRQRQPEKDQRDHKNDDDARAGAPRPLTQASPHLSTAILALMTTERSRLHSHTDTAFPPVGHPPGRLLGRHPSVGHDHGAGDERGLVRGQEQGHVGDLARLARPAHGLERVDRRVET